MNTEKELIEKAIAERIRQSSISDDEKSLILENCDRALLLSNTISQQELTRLINEADDEKKQQLLKLLSSIK